jgi:transposase
VIIGGVDTHTATHHAAVIDSHGRLFADAQFPASRRGYAALLAWMRHHGKLDKVGVEGTGAYGAGLARYLHEQGVTVLARGAASRSPAAAPACQKRPH